MCLTDPAYWEMGLWLAVLPLTWDENGGMGNVLLGLLLLLPGIGITVVGAAMVVNGRQVGTRLTKIGYPIEALRPGPFGFLRVFSGVALLLVGTSLIGFGVERL